MNWQWDVYFKIEGYEQIQGVETSFEAVVELFKMAKSRNLKLRASDIRRVEFYEHFENPTYDYWEIEFVYNFKKVYTDIETEEELLLILKKDIAEKHGLEVHFEDVEIKREMLDGGI